VRGFVALEPAFVASQMDAVLDDLPVGAIKTGMLANAGIVAAVVRELFKVNVPVIVDPVMIAKGGHALVDDAAVDVVRTRLLPRATLVTPNLPEAERLVGFPVRTLEHMEQAARALVQLGAQAALVKGGHASGDPTDVLCVEGEILLLTSARIDSTSTHGTGCTYSAAIAAYLARGVALREAVAQAHAYVHTAIETAPGLGRGHGPLHHMHPWYRFGPG
jgi:hydroxymethylpyrimidine/phosphomethylpyrimidine kinase